MERFFKEIEIIIINYLKTEKKTRYFKIVVFEPMIINILKKKYNITKKYTDCFNLIKSKGFLDRYALNERNFINLSKFELKINAKKTIKYQVFTKGKLLLKKKLANCSINIKMMQETEITPRASASLEEFIRNY